VPELLRRTGWIKACLAPMQRLQNRSEILSEPSNMGSMARFSMASHCAREPNLTGEFAGAIPFSRTRFVPDPGGLANAYAALLKRKGGRFLVGDARTLETGRRRMACEAAPMARWSRAKSW